MATRDYKPKDILVFGRDFIQNKHFIHDPWVTFYIEVNPDRYDGARDFERMAAHARQLLEHPAVTE